MGAIEVAVTLLAVVVPLLLGWIWQLWTSHNDLKLNVAENYVHKDHHQKSEEASDKRMVRVERLSQRTYEIMLQVAAKLGVSLPQQHGFGPDDG